MANIPYSDLKKGTLLIASPDIQGTLFYRSVILLCDHSSIGSFGLIVNKPLDIDPEKTFLNVEESNTQLNIHAGGPNQPNQFMLIQDQGYDEETSVKICEGVYLNGKIEINEDKKQMPQTLLCFGYTSWASGVLEREFLSGAWILCPGTKEYIFDVPSNELWQTLLRKLGGKYKTLSLMPENLDLN